MIVKILSSINWHSLFLLVFKYTWQNPEDSLIQIMERRKRLQEMKNDRLVVIFNIVGKNSKLENFVQNINFYFFNIQGLIYFWIFF